MSVNEINLQQREMKCESPDCNNLRIARGLCVKHYKRMKKAGVLPEKKKKQFSFLEPERIKEHLNKWNHLGKDTCWIYEGMRRGEFKKYAKIMIDGQTCSVHVISAWLFLGYRLPIKNSGRPEKIIMHICDNPPCFNPNHLQIGTYQENTKDMILKGRCPIVNDEKTGQWIYPV